MTEAYDIVVIGGGMLAACYDRGANAMRQLKVAVFHFLFQLVAVPAPISRWGESSTRAAPVTDAPSATQSLSGLKSYHHRAK